MSGTQIVTDTFNVRYDLRDARVTLILDTDLGDAAALSVSVSRLYQERGSEERYPVDYFSERGTVGQWRTPRTITLDHDAWRREIEKRQQMLAAAGEPFTVSRVSDDIEINFVVPVNQEAPFERWNANLIGSVVERSGDLRIVKREVVVRYPIDATNVGQTQFADPLNLASGTSYRASGELRLMPELDPVDPIAAISLIRRIGPREEFTVLQVTKHRNSPWYRVRTRTGEGWINSTAMLGQRIELVK